MKPCGADHAAPSKEELGLLLSQGNRWQFMSLSLSAYLVSNVQVGLTKCPV